MKISIVVPNFNGGRFLERTLRSIIEQGYSETELIVVDGGSTDESLDIIKKYEHHIAWWVSEPDRGQSHALNKGFARATGDILGWQNSDDVYLPGAFESAIRAFSEHPNKMVVYSNWYSIDENDQVIDVWYPPAKPRVPHFAYEGFDCFNQTLFWRRAAHERFGFFDETLQRGMDVDLLFRLIFNEGPCCFLKLNRFSGMFRRYDQQKTPRYELDEIQMREERYLGEKFGFLSSDSWRVCLYRIRHLLAKGFWSITQGGMGYTWKKFREGYRKRGTIL